jgi:hypothetical protein
MRKGYLCIDEVKHCHVCEGGGQDLLDNIVDEGNACLDSIIRAIVAE